MADREHFNFEPSAAIPDAYDVVDWPEPGDWPGRVERHKLYGRKRSAPRWFPVVRSEADGRTSWLRVPGEGYATRDAAGQALVNHPTARAIAKARVQQ